MDRNKTALERAFELAESGQCWDLTDVRTRLKSEGYDERHLKGPALRRQLREIVKKARAPNEVNSTTKAS